MKFINLTPHNIDIVLDSGLVKTIEPTGLARVAANSSIVLTLDEGIRLSKTIYGEVEGLPSPIPDTMYVVSQLVFNASDRTDLVVPADIVRDALGNRIKNFL